MNNKKYISFLVKEVLNVEQTKSVVAKSNLILGDIPYVTRTVSDNGYMGKCGNLEKVNQGNCITIGAETGIAFYQPNDFVAGNKVYRLSRDGLGEKEYLFLASILNIKTKNYSYSNARIPEKIKSELISLPVIESSDPNHKYTIDDIDWQYMEDRIKELEEDRIKELEEDRIKELDAYLKATNLDDYELTDEDKKVLHLSRKSASNENGFLETDCENGALRFKKFVVGDLFSSSTGDVDLQQKDINGKGAFLINSGVDNRGIKGRTDRKAKIFPANTITIDFWGNAYYRDFEYKMATHNHVFSLTGKIIKNRLVGLYLIGRLAKLPTLFSYNNMATWNKLRVLTVTLPVTPDGEPDFDYMERYIRAIEKLTIANVVKYKDKVIGTTKTLVNSQS